MIRKWPERFLPGLGIRSYRELDTTENMIDISIKEVVALTGGELLRGDPDTLLKGLFTDSRETSPGKTFVALSGERFNGMDFIPDALKKGARGVITDGKAVKDSFTSAEHLILVRDTRKALGDIASGIRKKLDLSVVCVTGTNGKTTVKDFLAALLSARFNVLKSERSFNNIIGLSLTLFRAERAHDIAILELGTNHPGEISGLAAIARPDVAVITNVGRGHLKFFKDTESVFKEKISLLNALPDDGIAFMNGDDSLLSKTKKGGHGISFYGRSDGVDLRITDVAREDPGYSFIFDGESYRVPTEGLHNVYNASAAIAVARHFGVTADEIRQKLTEVRLPDMRLEKTTVNGLIFINDSYNANPDSYLSALDMLKEQQSSGKKIVVSGEMMELGPASGAMHQMVGGRIAQAGVDFLVVVGNKAAALADGAIRSGMAEEKVFFADDHGEAARHILDNCSPGDTILLKGSRGSKMEEVLKCFTISFTR